MSIGGLIYYFAAVFAVPSLGIALSGEGSLLAFGGFCVCITALILLHP